MLRQDEMAIIMQIVYIWKHIYFAAWFYLLSPNIINYIILALYALHLDWILFESVLFADNSFC